MPIKKAIFTLLPKSYCSHFFGKLAALKFPQPLMRLVIISFAKLYQVNLEEIEGKISDYPSLASFFVRNLKQNARPIGDNIVSPVDGQLRAAGKTGERLEQIKGIDYDLARFLGSDKLAREMREGFYANYYLSPRDYHHVHAPLDGKLVEVRHIPGTLWPVSGWAIQNVSDLFIKNARTRFVFEGACGRFVLMMVGAFNVGDIRVSARLSNLPIQVVKGERIGTFNLGSSVVVLFPPAFEQKQFKVAGAAVKYGETIFS